MGNDSKARGGWLAPLRAAARDRDGAGATRAHTAAVLVVAAFGALVLLLAWKSSSWPLIHDAPIMHYIAWRILDGAVPYRDVFDMNFPGVYLFHVGVVATLGAGDGAWRLVDLGMTAAGAFAVAALAWPWGRLAAVGGALFFAAYHLASGAWNTGQRDFLLCPFLLVGALGIARWAEGGGAAALFASGVALGAGMTIKPHAVVFLAALVGFVVVWAARRERRLAGPVAALLGGAILAPAAVLTWLARLGALTAWRDIVFGYLVPLYSRVTRPADWMYFRWDPWVAITAALALALAGVVVARRFTARHAVVTLGLGYGLVHFVGQRKGWEYHLYPLAAFAAVLLFAGLDCAPRARRRVSPVPALAALAALVWLLGVKGIEASDSSWTAHKVRRVDALTADLATRVRDGHTVQVLDTTDGGAHAALRRRLAPPTRFVYDFHFYHHVDTPMIQRLRAELVRDLTARRPAAIVVWEAGWPSGGYERIDGFPALRHILESAYRLDVRGDGYRIYAKRHDS